MRPRTAAQDFSGEDAFDLIKEGHMTVRLLVVFVMASLVLAPAAWA
ncbi:hypothetical protein [Microvirga flavescens]|nr:hypothetical protein [Microvirga flavescens]